MNLENKTNKLAKFAKKVFKEDNHRNKNRIINLIANHYYDKSNALGQGLSEFYDHEEPIIRYLAKAATKRIGEIYDLTLNAQFNPKEDVMYTRRFADKRTRTNNPLQPQNTKPSLDYYDNKRDRFGSGELVPHQGTFGWYEQN